MEQKKQKPSSSKEKGNGKSSISTDRFNSVQSALTHLSTPGSKYQFDALVAIRKKFTKDDARVSTFRQNGGISKLLSLLENHETGKNMKDVALSILGNCCMDAKCRKEVLWKDGIPIICEVLTTTEVESIQNRACRTLGNLSLDAECCDSVHQQDDLLLFIVELFTKASESDTKLTFARTIRLLGDTAQHQKAVVASEGIKPLGDLLKSEDQAIITAGMKGITELTKTINSSIARQLISSEAPASLIKLTTHTNPTISAAAENLIMNYTKSEELRPAIGGAGGIKYFMDGINNTDLSKSKRLSMANAICLCCHDSVNRFRIRSQQGLDLLIEVLGDDKFNLIHNRVISSLVCFLYDEASLEILCGNGLIKKLIQHLRRVAKLGPEIQEAKDFCKNRKIYETVLSDETDIHKDFKDENAILTSPEEVSQSKKNCEIVTDSKDHVIDNPMDEVETDSITAGSGAMKSSVAFEKGGGKSPGIEVAHSKESTQNIRQKEDLGTKEESVEELNTESDAAGKESKDSDRDTSVRKSTCTLKESHSEPILSQSTKPVKYSMDSPTYKEVAEWKFEDHYSGPTPTNIHDSAHYWANSPEMVVPSLSPTRSGPYSPLSTGSEDWSPEHSPEHSPVHSPIHSPVHSPTSRDSLQPFSPVHSPNSSPLHQAYMADSPSMYGLLSPAPSPQWSPTIAHQSPARSTSPDGSPLKDQGSWWCTPALNECALEYSSDEEESSDTKVGPKEPETDHRTDAMDTAVPSTSREPAVVPTFEATGAPLESLQMFAEVNCVESKAVEIKRKLVNRRESSNKKTKPNEAPGTKFNILRAVETSSSSSVDLNKMISEMPETPESASDYKKERLQFAKDPRKITEHNILIILSRFSYLDNPKKYLITIRVWMCLLDYMRKVSKPLPRAERILMRLVKNPLCFEALVEMTIPFHISYQLSELRNNSYYDKSEVTLEKKEISEGDKESSASRKVSFTVGGETPETSKEDNTETQTSSSDAKSEQSSNLDVMKQHKDQLLNCLTLVTESQFGRGVLAHILMKKSVKHRHQCAISLAYICRSKEQRKKMYLSLDGLKWLFQAASSSDIVIQTKGLLSLLQLAKEIRETSPKKDVKDDSKSQYVQTLTDVLTRNKRTGHDVCFKLEDGKIVHGHRGTLAAGSEVFAAMLHGHYSESNLHVIDISDASESSFQILINYLHIIGLEIEESHSKGDEKDIAQPQRKRMATELSNVIVSRKVNESSEHNDSSKIAVARNASDAICTESTVKLESNLDILIELLGLADRFMLQSLQNLIADHITTRYLTPENVLQSCQFALLYNCRKLAENCIGFIIFGEMPIWQRVACIVQVFNSDNSMCLDLLKDLITRHISY